MKILTKGKQEKITKKIKELNSLIFKSNIDLKAYDLLADIGCLVLDMKYLYDIEDEIIEKFLKNLKIKKKKKK